MKAEFVITFVIKVSTSSINVYSSDKKAFINGDLIPLDYVTREFPRLLERCGLRKIKLHELRHINISLLVENGANMKSVQEWAGHSSYSTTANVYAHIQSQNKIKLSEKLTSLLE